MIGEPRLELTFEEIEAAEEALGDFDARHSDVKPAPRIIPSVLGLQDTAIPVEEVTRIAKVLAETRTTRVGADRDRLKRSRTGDRNRNWRSRQYVMAQDTPTVTDSVEGRSGEGNGVVHGEDSDGRRLFDEISKGTGVVDWKEYRLAQARERGEKAGAALILATKEVPSQRKLIVYELPKPKGLISVPTPKRTAPSVLR